MFRGEMEKEEKNVCQRKMDADIQYGLTRCKEYFPHEYFKWKHFSTNFLLMRQTVKINLSPLNKYLSGRNSVEPSIMNPHPWDTVVAQVQK